MLFPTIIDAIDVQAQRLDCSRSELIQNILSDYIIDNDLFFSKSDEQINGQLEVV